MDIQIYLQSLYQWLLGVGVKLLLVAILTIAAMKGSRLFTKRLFEHLKKRSSDLEFDKRAETLQSIMRSVLDGVLLLVVGMIILDLIGIDVKPLLAAAGVVGLAVGFGAQKLVEDVISGFFILLDNQIRVGDVVQIGDKVGSVERVNIRLVTLRDLAGNVHFIRNGSIGVVSNMTRDYSRYVFDIGVAYREDTDAVVKIIKEVDEELRADPVFKHAILEPIEILGLDKFADSAVIIKARTKTQPVKQWEVGREFNRRLKKAFEVKGIEIPFPQMTLTMTQKN